MIKAFPSAALILVATSPCLADIVTQYQVNAAHTGAVSDSVYSIANTPLWTVSAAAVGAQSIVPGVVSDGKNMYVTASISNGGDYNGYQIISMNASTGNTNWTYNRTAFGTSASAPSVMNGTVFAQFGGHSGISGGNSTQYPYMVGVQATNGQQVFATSYQAQWGYANQPTVIGQQVFGMAGYYGGMQAYSASTGATQWYTGLPQQTGFVPAADASHVYVYMGRGDFSPGPEVATLYAINRVTGAIDYSIQDANGGYFPSNPNVMLGSQHDAIAHTTQLYNNDQITSFDLQNQSIRWKVNVSPTGEMAVSNGKVYVPAGDKVYIYDEATGTSLGYMEAGVGVNLTGNALATNNVLFISSDNATYAFDRNTLAEVWSTNDGGQLSWDNGLLVISNPSSVEVFQAAVPEPTPAFLSALGALMMALAYRERFRVNGRVAKA